MSSEKRYTILRTLVTPLLAFGVIGLYALIALNLKIFNPISQVMKDYSITDFYYQVQGLSADKDTSRIVTIVDMTDIYSRHELAMVLQEIKNQQPKTIGVDMVFEGLKEDTEGDSLIAAVAAGDTTTVFGYKLTDDSFYDNQYHEEIHSFFADSLPHLKEGFVNMPRDIYGGLKRKINLGSTVNGEMRPSIVKQVADIYADQEVVPLADRMVKINFAPLEFRVIPPDSVAYYGEYIADHIVFFGAMRDEIDIHYTPQGKLPGVELLAYSVETLIKNMEIRETPWWMTAIISYLIVMVIFCFFRHYDNFANNRKNPALRISMKTTLAKGIMRFCFMAILMYIGFLLFGLYNVSINFVWALSAIAVNVTANDLYEVLYNSFNKNTKSNEENTIPAAPVADYTECDGSGSDQGSDSQ